MKMYGVGLCQFLVQPLIVLSQLTDCLRVSLDGALGLLIVRGSVALLWWKFNSEGNIY